MMAKIFCFSAKYKPIPTQNFHAQCLSAFHLLFTVSACGKEQQKQGKYGLLLEFVNNSLKLYEKIKIDFWV